MRSIKPVALATIAASAAVALGAGASPAAAATCESQDRFVSGLTATGVSCSTARSVMGSVLRSSKCFDGDARPRACTVRGYRFTVKNRKRFTGKKGSKRIAFTSTATA